MIKNRILGLIVTAMGLIVLISSLILAYLEYTLAKRVGVSDLEGAITGLINVFITVIPKLIWVGVMIAIGSILLSKGVQLLRTEKVEGK